MRTNHMFLRISKLQKYRANHTPHYQPGNFVEPEQVTVYNTLSEVVDSDNKVFTKVCLAELVTKPKPSEQNLKHWRRVQRRTLDFLICSEPALEPILAIKLDTESDSKLRRKLGPDVMDEVLDDIGLPLLRINAEDASHAEFLTHKLQFAKEEYRQKMPNSTLELKIQETPTTIANQFIVMAKSPGSYFWAGIRNTFHRLVLRVPSETSK